MSRNEMWSKVIAGIPECYKKYLSGKDLVALY